MELQESLSHSLYWQKGSDHSFLWQSARDGQNLEEEKKRNLFASLLQPQGTTLSSPAAAVTRMVKLLKRALCLSLSVSSRPLTTIGLPCTKGSGGWSSLNRRCCWTQSVHFSGSPHCFTHDLLHPLILQTHRHLQLKCTHSCVESSMSFACVDSIHTPICTVLRQP